MHRLTTIILILAASFLAVESRHLRQVDTQHYGGSGWWIDSGKKHSSWNHGSHYYHPVTSDKSWTYYRLAVRLSINITDTYSPSNLTKVSLFMGVSYGKAYDLSTGAEIGVWQAFTVSTTDEDPGAGMTIGTISSLVLELGPQGDDSIAVAGATSTTVPTADINDHDNAVTGGIGRYLGAAGEFIYKNMPGGPVPTAIEAEINLWTPKLKTF